MALSALPEPAGQQEETAAAAPGPRARTVREQFDALPEDLKAKILSEHRDWNTEHIDWWDSVYAMFERDMAEIGIDVDRMYFSGFWSQGDGACFEGSVRDWELFLKSRGYTDAALIKHAQDYFEFSVRHSGRYYHEHCTSFSAEMPLPEDADDNVFADNYTVYEQGSLHRAVALANLAQYDEDKLATEFAEAFKDHMQTLYGMLEEEYEHLTSDEAILDSLEANDQLEEAINNAMESEYA